MALNDFLAQSHIDDMREQANRANAKIDVQKKANDDAAAAAKAAEDRRYNQQVMSFDRQMDLLKAYLAKHPGEWSKVNQKVLGLLKSYGVDYKKAGILLGNDFVEGLRSNIAAARAAAAELAALTATATKTPENSPTGSVYTPSTPASGYPPGVQTPGDSVTTNQPSMQQIPPPPSKPAIPTPYSGGGRPYGLDTGAWRILKDNTLAMLHRDEMVAPADAAGLLRQLGAERKASMGGTSGGGVIRQAAESSSGGTIILQIGDEQLGEITDQRLQVQSNIYGPRRLTLRSRR